jgi:hypothetical protein
MFFNSHVFIAGLTNFAPWCTRRFVFRYPRDVPAIYHEGIVVVVQISLSLYDS